MPHARRSFRLRLVLAAAVWIGLGLAASWLGLRFILTEHLEVEFEEELQHHAAELAGLVAITADGRLALRQELSDRRFFETGSGQYWQVRRADGEALRSASLGTTVLPLPPAADAAGRVLDIAGPTGRLRLLIQVIRPRGSDETVVIGLGIDASVIDDLLRRFSLALLLSLTLIATGLVAAVVAQVTYGLWPMVRVREGLAAIRRGEASRLSEDLPAEVAPLAVSLNAMIQANDDVVRRARTQAGNLAHALQTPIAILLDEGRRMQAAGGNAAVVLREVERMRRHIDFHLAHARASASRGRPYAVAPLMATLRTLLLAMSRLHQARGLAFELLGGPDSLTVACETEDLEEMLGNLIDNAAKWAHRRVQVTARAGSSTLGSATLGSGGMVAILIEDDGPGMPEEAREQVFQPGARLDEAVAGHGLGLAIVRDVATLYDGQVTIGDSPLGGACVRLDLPHSRTG